MKIDITTDESTIVALDKIAANLDTTRSDVVNRALKMYIDYITWFKSEVQRGIDDVNVKCTINKE